jgi:hypothetical protein
MAGWALSLSLACGIIEPLNIMALALMPLLVTGDGPIAQCYARVYWCYAEIFAD